MRNRGCGDGRHSLTVSGCGRSTAVGGVQQPQVPWLRPSPGAMQGWPWCTPLPLGRCRGASSPGQGSCCSSEGPPRAGGFSHRQRLQRSNWKRRPQLLSKYSSSSLQLHRRRCTVSAQGQQGLFIITFYPESPLILWAPIAHAQIFPHFSQKRRHVLSQTVTWHRDVCGWPRPRPPKDPSEDGTW